MATLGTLAVNVVANTAGLITGLNRGRGAVRGFGAGITGSLGGMVSFVARIAAIAGVTLGAAAAVSKLAESARRLDALAKLADRIEEVPQAIVQLERAAELTGAGSQALDKGLEILTRRLGEVRQGTGEAKDALRVLGLDADKLASMSPAAAFKDIAEAINQLPNQADKAAAAYKLFGRQGQLLVNTLALGKNGLAEVAAETDRLRGTLSSVELDKIESMNDAIGDLQLSVAGLVDRLLVEFSDEIEDVVRAATELVVWIRNLDSATITNTAKWVAMAAAFVGVLALIPRIVAAVRSIIVTLQALTTAQAVATAFSGPQGWAILAGSAIAAGVAAAAVGAEFDALFNQIDKDTSVSQDAAKQNNDLTESFEAQRKAIEEAARARKALFDEGQRVTESLRSPFEKMIDDAQDLKRLLDAGAISWTTFNRGIQKAASDYEMATQAKKDFDAVQRKSIGAFELGSTQAFSAVQDARNAQTNAAREMAQRAKEAADRDKKRNETLAAIRRAVESPVAAGTATTPEIKVVSF